MTVNYNDVISSGHQCVFLRLLTIWKGSIYKLVWVDLMIYVCIYYVINFVYRFTLNEPQRRTFEEIVKFCEGMKNNIPLSFLLGFFVAGVITRWWKMYYAIPWLNRVAFVSQSFLIGNGPEKSRQARFTLMRYMNLSWILLMRQISDQIQGRFPSSNLDNTAEEPNVKAILESINSDSKIQLTFRKIVTESEIRAMERIASEKESRENGRYVPEFWIPLQWGVRFVQKLYIHGYIADPRTMIAIIEEIDNLRKQMQTLKIYSDILIPLVYTQVVIIAVYSYFLCQMFAAQFVDPRQKIKGHEVDFYFPVFTIFQFLFLMGWLKVAMCVMNPFGDDDEDFATSTMLDYNLDVTYRSAGAEDDMYPMTLKPAVVKYKRLDTAEQDNLMEFFTDEARELDSVYQPNHDHDYHGQYGHEQTSFRRTTLQRLRNIFTCTRQTHAISSSERHSVFKAVGTMANAAVVTVPETELRLMNEANYNDKDSV